MAWVREVADVLTASASAWNREDVVRAFCDVQRPLPGFDGRQWAAGIEKATDQFIDRCVNLDPEHTQVSRVRVTDGRSQWIEPVAAQFTMPWILDEEHQILDWAHTAQLAGPAPPITVEAGIMDTMQQAAAAAIAGDDRLVIVIGPAGAGKTTTLAYAVHDLTDIHNRPAYGVAPTAKAAHTLAAETGMACDTVAKLIHEWTQPDRPPGPAWQLAAGTTLIVDEAGMLGTPSLGHLSELADTNQWRLVLVGDPNQIQAVGRGGMFGELCTTGRSHQLQRIHRFQEPWEADASLQLRYGNPTALADYDQHDRIRAGTLAEHLDHIANQWLTHHRRGQTFAVMASTNDHVDTINQHIQTIRLQQGQLPADTSIEIADGRHAHLGDMIATRRNARDLRTDHDEPVRNRDLWTIVEIHDNGDLTATSNAGGGTLRLPADYIREHVQLGYATTEMGAQSITADAAIELASKATTCRNLYVALTRGRTNNTVCVITDTHNPDDALDILERVLATDRADTPATTVQHQLAQAVPASEHDFLDNNWIVDELKHLARVDHQDIDYGIER